MISTKQVRQSANFAFKRKGALPLLPDQSFLRDPVRPRRSRVRLSCRSAFAGLEVPLALGISGQLDHDYIGPEAGQTHLTGKTQRACAS